MELKKKKALRNRSTVLSARRGQDYPLIEFAKHFLPSGYVIELRTEPNQETPQFVQSFFCSVNTQELQRVGIKKPG